MWPSPVLVVSLRVGLAAAIAFGLVGAALDLERAYWIVATAVLVLHQDLDWNRSVQRGLERVIGTLLGLVLAGAVLWLAPQGFWLALTLAALQFMICMLVVHNRWRSSITAAAITMVSSGHAVENIAALLWDRVIDTVTGCVIGIGVLRITAPRAVAVRIPQEIAAALDTARVLKFAAAGDAVFPGSQTSPTKPAAQGNQLTAYELGAGARLQDRRFAEGLWPAVVAAQRFLYRLLAFCWTLEETGTDEAGKVARAAFGATGLRSLGEALAALSDAARNGQTVTISADIPSFLKGDVEDLSRSIIRQREPD